VTKWDGKGAQGLETSWHQTGYPVYSPASLRLQSCSSNGSSSNFNGKGFFLRKVLSKA